MRFVMTFDHRLRDGSRKFSLLLVLFKLKANFEKKKNRFVEIHLLKISWVLNQVLAFVMFFS